MRLIQQLDLRYLHQGYHLTVEAPQGEVKEEHKETEGNPQVKLRFRRAHREIQGLAHKLNVIGDKVGDIEELLREKVS